MSPISPLSPIILLSPMARRKIINKQNSTGPWNEIIGLILIGIGIVILLALISYDSRRSVMEFGEREGSRAQLGRADGRPCVQRALSGFRGRLVDIALDVVLSSGAGNGTTTNRRFQSRRFWDSF